ncbi:MAG: ABC transporter permease subunit [Clostridia bacterium]|nr:ABC transporter permease subunit [Clostridia bacterium]
MTAFFKRHWLTVLFAVLSIGFMFAAWAVSWHAKGNELIVPSIGSTLSQFFKLFAEGEFWKSLGMTFARTLMAVGISFVLAALCTVLGLVYAPFKAFFSPIIAVCRTVPTMAVTLVIMLTFSSTMTPVIVTMLVIFPMFYAQITAAVDGVDRGLLEMSKVYGVNKRAVVSKIIIPQIAPAIVMQLGTVLSFALKLTISAEVLAYAYNGIGGMMKTANFATEIARLSALTLASVAAGLIIEALFFVITKISFKWKRI